MKKFKRLFKCFLVAVGAVLILDAGVLAFFSFYQPPLKKAGAIVILGAAINSPVLYNRSVEGLKLYEQGQAPLLVLSGGRISDADISEAQYMQKVILRQAAQELSKPLPLGEKNKQAMAVNLILEQESHSTFENLQNSKKLLPPDSSIIIVTDDYHLARSVLTALRLGFKNVQWRSPKPEDYSFRNLAYYYLREEAAMLDYLPKFIPIPQVHF